MVLLPQDAIIADEKIKNYLLVHLLKDDKSKSLAQAGYTLDNWQRLQQDIRAQILTQPADRIETNRYGKKYAIRASLRGVNEIEIDTLTIWMVTNNTARFVTLVPDKENNL